MVKEKKGKYRSRKIKQVPVQLGKVLGAEYLFYIDSVLLDLYSSIAAIIPTNAYHRT